MKRTSTQIAKFLNISYDSTYRFLSRSELEKFRIGKYYTINAEFLKNLYDAIEKRSNDCNKNYEKKLKYALNKLYKYQQSLNKRIEVKNADE